jgi:hypothetical protein
MTALPRSRVVPRSALATLVCLCGAVVPAFAAMGVVNRFLPALAERAGPMLFHAFVLVSSLLGGWVWARVLARIAGRGDARRIAWGGALGFGVAMPLALGGLTAAESELMRLAMDGREVPAHLAFGTLFAAATFGVVGATTLLLGLGAGSARAAARLALRCAGAATLVFVCVALGFDLLGWRVGAPGAEERFTMLVVTAVGVVGAALVGGGVLGRALAGPRAAA